MRISVFLAQLKSICPQRGVELSAAVGNGFVPMKEILDDLSVSGFNGSITAELFGTKDSLADILTSVKWMKQYE